MNVREVTLRGRHVVLEPLCPEHADELAAVAFDPEIWQWMPTRVTDRAGLGEWIEARRADILGGASLPFLQRDAKTGQAFGSTSIFDIRAEHRGVEIGHTWLAASHRRTAANTEAKLLLLTFCFEDLGALRVQLKTDLRNLRSQRAIERLGAAREGVLRKHVVMPDGYVRDTVMYSILDTEWPAVKARLLRFLSNRGQDTGRGPARR